MKSDWQILDLCIYKGKYGLFFRSVRKYPSSQKKSYSLYKAAHRKLVWAGRHLDFQVCLETSNHCSSVKALCLIFLYLNYSHYV